MSTKKTTCSYAVKDIGKETDGSCNAPAIKKYSSKEMPLCRLHYYMKKCELLEEEIEELLAEELVCDYCDPPEDDTAQVEVDAATEFYEENDIQGLRGRRDFQEDVWEADETLVQPLQHEGCQSWQSSSEDYFQYHRSHMVMAMKCQACSTNLYSEEKKKKKH